VRGSAAVPAPSWLDKLYRRFFSDARAAAPPASSPQPPLTRGEDDDADSGSVFSELTDDVSDMTSIYSAESREAEELAVDAGCDVEAIRAALAALPAASTQPLAAPAEDVLASRDGGDARAPSSRVSAAAGHPRASARLASRSDLLPTSPRSAAPPPRARAAGVADSAMRLPSAPAHPRRSGLRSAAGPAARRAPSRSQ
jgi:hypothetical protein